MNIKHHLTSAFTSGLKKFNNIHKGETCYIFGDGPSIKWFDLKKFNNHPSICCGMIPFHNDFSYLDVKYVSLVEPWIFTPRMLQPKIIHNLKDIAIEYKKFIKRTPEKEFFISLSNRFSLTGSNVNYVYCGLPENRKRTDELLNEFNLFSGSFHATLTLAYYMGFTKIYLVGFDAWTIQPARTLRWYELGEGELFEATNFATDFLDVLKRDVDIYTISKDGKSRNVNNISYKDFTGNDIRFKENHQLMDPYYLNVLSTCSEYKIY